MPGANGAGKSPPLKAQGAMVGRQPTVSIALDGVELSRLPGHRIVDAALALVPEGRGQFGELAVRDNLMFGARPRHAYAHAHESSKGYALVSQPAILPPLLMCRGLFARARRMRDDAALQRADLGAAAPNTLDGAAV
ncbi:hypothetical protein ACDA63_00205 [Uliginosibacterium sp. sgz301328]|uniref:hypothetical protein n=1 Tax=Uliginosibacterium sp. sgz301328 TaxID=3243764 RepID=UPI00359CE9F1